MLRHSLLVLVLPLLLLLTACSDDEPETSGDSATPTASASAATTEIEIQGTDGVSVTLDETPQRIVSLAAHATEIICTLGAGDLLVAVDSYENCPAGSAEKPQLDSFQASVEAITAHDPDFVYMFDDPSGVAPALRDLGMTVLVLDVPPDIKGVFTNIEQIGNIVGEDEAASQVIDDMQAQRDAVLERVGDIAAGTTYFHELDSTYFTVRSDTFVGSLYALLGAENIADGADSAYPQLSVEAIVAADPEVIVLVDDESAASVAARPGWDTIDAVENGHICELDGNLLSRPGPRVMEGLEALAECLYPEA